MNLEPQILTPEPELSIPSPGIESCPPPPSIPDPLLPHAPSRRKPTGKIASLPRAQRDLINQMLDDGATYDAIEVEMAKHGVSLNGENISNWFQNGFQQY